MSDFQKQHGGHRCTVAHLVASANIYPGAALFFKQIVEKLILIVLRINSLMQLGVLPPIHVATS